MKKNKKIKDKIFLFNTSLFPLAPISLCMSDMGLRNFIGYEWIV